MAACRISDRVHTTLRVGTAGRAYGPINAFLRSGCTGGSLRSAPSPPKIRTKAAYKNRLRDRTNDAAKTDSVRKWVPKTARPQIPIAAKK